MRELQNLLIRMIGWKVVLELCRKGAHATYVGERKWGACA